MGRRYSSTLDPLTLWNQQVFSSATHHFTASSPTSNLPPLLPLFSSSHFILAHCRPFVTRSLHRVTLHDPGFPRPCKQGPCAVSTHPTNKGLTAAPSTGALARAPLLQSSSDASVPSSASTHNEFTFAGIYSPYWEADTAIAIQNIPQTQGEAVGYFCSLPCMTVPQQSKGSFALM